MLTPTPIAGEPVEATFIKSQPGVRGGRRVVLSEGGFDLNQLHNSVIISLPKCAGAYISVTPVAGTWSTAAVAIQIPSVGKMLPFGTAKDISAGGGLVTLTEEDCLGLTEIAIVVTTAEGAFSRAAVTVQIEEQGA